MRITPDLRTPDFVRSEEKRQNFNWNRFYFTIMFGAFAALRGAASASALAGVFTGACFLDAGFLFGRGFCGAGFGCSGSGWGGW